MLTNEDLLMISEIFDVKFEAQNRRLDDKLAQQNEELKKEIRQTKFELRQEMQSLEGGLHQEMQSLEGEFRQELRDIGIELQDVKNETRSIRLLLENDIQPRLSTIESCYVDTAERYYKGVAEIDSMKGEVDILKKVAKEHGEKLRKIQ